MVQIGAMSDLFDSTALRQHLFSIARYDDVALLRLVGSRDGSWMSTRYAMESELDIGP